MNDGFNLPPRPNTIRVRKNDPRLAFVFILKNALTSIIHGLDFHDSVPVKDIFYKKIIPDVTFAILRTPLNRFLSGFSEICRRQEPEEIKLRESFECFKSEDLIETFLGFIEVVENFGSVNNHIRPQIDFVTYEDKGMLPINRFYNFDRINGSNGPFNLINEFNLTGPNLSSKHMNHSDFNVTSKLYQFVFNNYEVKNRIEKIYSKDYELINNVKFFN